jgi:hypothetical protein
MSKMLPKLFGKITALIPVFCLISCYGNRDKNNVTASSVKDSGRAAVSQASIDAEVREINTADSLLVGSSRQITGVWTALDGEDNLTVTISKDSVFYTEHAESHRFELKRDSIFIYYPDYTLTGRPLLLKDTFAIIAEDHVSKFLPVKN